LTTGATYEYEVEAVFSNGESNLSESIAFVPSTSGTCNYAVSSPNHGSIPSEGGNGSVTVTSASSCIWKATSNLSWIGITSGGSGSGNGSVSYVVFPNTSPNTRTGALTIASQSVQITQLGADPNDLTPLISEVSPSSAVAGSGAFIMNVSGSGFMPGSFVAVNSIVQETTYVNSTLLNVVISSDVIASSGSKPVVVHNPPPGAKISNVASLTVQASSANPTPWISAIFPRMATVGSGPLTVTIYGWGFINDSTARFNGSNRQTIFVNAGQLMVEIPGSDLANVGAPLITVFNTGPGGGLSNSATFYVNSDLNIPAPSITAISPASVTAGSPSFTLVVDGSGFMGTSQVRINEIWCTTTYVSSTRLTAVIRSTDIEAEGTLTITVYNPQPGGGISEERTLTISPPLTGSIAPDTFNYTTPGNDWPGGNHNNIISADPDWLGPAISVADSDAIIESRRKQTFENGSRRERNLLAMAALILYGFTFLIAFSRFNRR